MASGSNRTILIALVQIERDVARAFPIVPRVFVQPKNAYDAG